MKQRLTLYLTCLVVIMFTATPIAFAQDQKTGGNKTVVKIPKEGKSIDLKTGNSSLRVGGDSKNDSDSEAVDAKTGNKAVRVKIDDKAVKVKTNK